MVRAAADHDRATNPRGDAHLQLPEGHAVPARWRRHLRRRGSRFAPLPGFNDALSLRVLRRDAVQLHDGLVPREGAFQPQQQAGLSQRHDGVLGGLPGHDDPSTEAAAAAAAAGVPLWARDAVPAHRGRSMFSARLAPQRVPAADDEVQLPVHRRHAVLGA